MTNYTYWVKITETRTKHVPVVVDVGDRADGFARSDRQAAEVMALAEASTHPWKEPETTTLAEFWQQGDRRTPQEIERTELARQHAAENKILEDS